jgi:HAD superfamily hydrolase (TIGR01509 family)
MTRGDPERLRWTNGGASRTASGRLAYRAGVPDQAEPPSPRQPAGQVGDVPANSAPRGNGAVPIRRVEAVLFDFHGTLAQVEDPISWVHAGAAACGTALDAGAATVLADRLVTAGRAGGPVPTRVPPQLIEVWAERDLYAHAHRAAYTGLAATVAAHVNGLPDALYERLLTPDGWLAYSDAVATLTAVRATGARTAVVSNVGFDIRPILDGLGMAGLFDAYVLSFELGRTKPDPAIFRAACAALGTDPEHTLMVGDTPADAAAVSIGCAAYLVPAAGPGATNGLGAVSALVSGLSPKTA